MDIISYNGNVSLTKRGKIFYLFFLRFLKENKCFYAYQRAFSRNVFRPNRIEYLIFSRNVFRPNRIEYLIKLCNTWNTSIISNSFIWSNTIEGHKFWERIDKKFKRLSYQLSLR